MDTIKPGSKRFLQIRGMLNSVMPPAKSACIFILLISLQVAMLLTGFSSSTGFSILKIKEHQFWRVFTSVFSAYDTASFALDFIVLIYLLGGFGHIYNSMMSVVARTLLYSTLVNVLSIFFYEILLIQSYLGFRTATYMISLQNGLTSGGYGFILIFELMRLVISTKSEVDWRHKVSLVVMLYLYLSHIQLLSTFIVSLLCISTGDMYTALRSLFAQSAICQKRKIEELSVITDKKVSPDNQPNMLTGDAAFKPDQNEEMETTTGDDAEDFETIENQARADIEIFGTTRMKSNLKI